MKLNFKEILGITVLLFFFGLSAYWSREYGDVLKEMMGETGGYLGMSFYFFLTVLAVVIAPFSTLPLLPVAVSLWGEFMAVALLVFGWLLGDVIAFLIARRWGRPLIRKFVNLKKVDDLEDILGTKNLFMTVLLLRMVVPVDVLSYALGLLAKMSLRDFTLASFLGMIPFAFVFAYASNFTLFYQGVTLFIVMIFAILGFKYIKKVKDKNY